VCGAGSSNASATWRLTCSCNPYRLTGSVTGVEGANRMVDECGFAGGRAGGRGHHRSPSTDIAAYPPPDRFGPADGRPMAALSPAAQTRRGPGVPRLGLVTANGGEYADQTGMPIDPTACSTQEPVSTRNSRSPAPVTPSPLEVVVAPPPPVV